MSAAYFSTPAHIRRLAVELQSWIGTPFAEGQAVKLAGADCPGFVSAVLLATGAVRKMIEWPPYVCFGEPDSSLAKITATADKVKDLTCVFKVGRPQYMPTAMEGDVMIFTNGKMVHCGIVGDDQKNLWHCGFRRGVTQVNVHEPKVVSNIHAIYRATR